MGRPNSAELAREANTIESWMKKSAVIFPVLSTAVGALGAEVVNASVPVVNEVVSKINPEVMLKTHEVMGFLFNNADVLVSMGGAVAGLAFGAWVAYELWNWGNEDLKSARAAQKAAKLVEWNNNQTGPGGDAFRKPVPGHPEKMRPR